MNGRYFHCVYPMSAQGMAMSVCPRSHSTSVHAAAMQKTRMCPEVRRPTHQASAPNSPNQSDFISVRSTQATQPMELPDQLVTVVPIQVIVQPHDTMP